jgi:hypothetical protein
VLDHNRAKTGIVVGYTGERGRNVDGDYHSVKNEKKEVVLKGYVKNPESQRNGGKAFVLNGHYKGGGDEDAIWYEMPSGYQHPGYDYRINSDSYTVAPADGTLWIAKEDPVNGKRRKTSAWLGYHTFKIVHSNGLVTWYLHSARFVSPAKDGAGTRDLDSEVRNKMGGDAFYDGSRALTGDIEVGPVRAGEKIAKPGNWGTGGPHLHFEVRLNGDQDANLIDPYGWEGDGADPLPANTGEILWDGYSAPSVSSAVIDQNAGTLTVTGSSFEAGSTLDIWRKFENDATNPANKKDGTLLKNLSLQGTPSSSRIVANVGQDVINNIDSYVVKVVTPSGPRSRAVRMTIGQPSPQANDFSLQVIPFYQVVTNGETAIFTILTQTTSGSPQPLALSVEGLPSGMSFALSSTSINSGGVVTLAVTTSASTPRDDYPFTIVAKGTVEHRENVQLTVSGTPKAVISMSGGGQSGGNDATLTYTVPPNGNVLMTLNASGSRSPGGSIKSYSWSSNGTEFSTSPGLDYHFGKGTHHISLTVGNGTGLIDTATATIVVNESNATPPKAVISMSGGGQTGGNGDTLRFVVSPGGSTSISFNAIASQAGSGSTITAYEWRSNGGFMNDVASFNFPFAAATHRITLKVTNSAGLTDTATATIIVTEDSTAPHAVISMGGGNQTGGNGSTLRFVVATGDSIPINFNGSSSTAGSGSITSYEWRSNGGFMSNLSSFNFRFAAATHTITLRVTNSSGVSDTATATIIVTTATSTPPIAHFSMSAQGKTANDGGTLSLSVPVNGNVTVSFSSTSTQGSAPITNFVWKSNGTQICTNASACNFNFGTPGNTITLTVTDGNGLTSTATGQVNLSFQSGLAAHFSMSAQGQSASDGGTLGLTVPVNGNVTVNFTSTSSQGGAPITNYIWKSNGTQICSNSSTCSFNFGTASNTISLTVTDSNGQSSTATGTVTLSFQSGPTAHFSMGAQGQTANDGGTLNLSVPVNGNVTVNFASTSSPGGAPITSYVWKSNGTQICSNASTCSFNFGTANNTITLTVMDGNGISATATGQVHLSFQSGPTAHFTMGAQGQTANDGGTLSLSVPVNGNVTVNFTSTSSQGSASITNYVWKSNGTQICSNSSTCNFNFGTASNSITLTVTDSNGLTSTATGQVNLSFQSGPAAHFSMSAQGQTANDGGTLNLSVPVNGNVTVSFNSTSSQGSAPITSYVWRSNGTQICTNASTCSFNFGTASNSITLTVTDSNGLSSTATGQVNLSFQSGPTAHFSMSAQGQAANDGGTLNLSVAVNGSVTVNFTSTSTQGSAPITNYVWKSNGTQICANSSTCNFNFGTASNTITLTVTDSSGLSSTATGQVNLSFLSGPAAHFLMSAQGRTANDGGTLSLSVPVNGNVTVSFSSTSTQGSAPITSYVWKSNGTQICSNSSTCNFNFGTASNTITLTVTDSNGLSSTATGQVSLNFISGPTAHFSMSGQGQTANDGGTLSLSVPVNGSVTVNFTSTSSQGSASITNYVWKSNGTQICSNSSTCSFTFGTASNTITLTVTDSNGQSSTATGQVNLSFQSGPTAHFSMSAQGRTANDGSTLSLSVPVNGNVTVSFNSTSSQGSAPITSYVWRSNGTQICSNSSTCSFNFGTASNTITLTVTDSNGLSSTATGQVNLSFITGPTAHFSMTAQGKTANDGGTLSLSVPVNGSVTVNFTSTSSQGTAPITNYVWKSNGTQICTNSSTCSFTFGTAGNTITLTVTDSNGFSSTATGQVNLSFH